MERSNGWHLIGQIVLRVEQYVIGGGILGIAAIGITNVIARNLLGSSFAFAEEANQTLMIWITFGGLGYAARRARHIRMAAFYDQLRGRARKITWICITAGTAVVLAILTLLAASYVMHVYEVGGVTPALRIPLWITYSIAPVGLAIGCLEYVLTLIRNFRSEDIFASSELLEDAAGIEEGSL
jgi:TRAP-type C4-dicarboxylate transport system permease small subunit